MIYLIDREFITKYRAEILLFGILALSAFLNLWNIWNQGITNSYYAAAVKSMLVNPGIAFFNSFDPAGFVTVDKPPVGLWVQAAFAAVLGFSGWVLVLPQALAGVGSVALIYLIVSRPFGKTTGLVSALALAVTPILVAVSRNGTMDTQLIFVLLLAVWAALKAARERSLPWFLVSVVLLGIGFNIKMIQAYIAVPAVLAVYFLGTTDVTWKKRILHVGLAIVVLLAVSLSWATAVDMIPADQRPYIGGSGDNTVLGLIINYNGIHRLESDGMGGMGGGSGTGGPGMSATGQPGRGSSVMAATGQAGSPFAGPEDRQGTTSGGTAGSQTGGPGGFPGAMASSGQGQGQQTGSSGIMSGSLPGSGGMGGGGMNDGGSPGITRLFGEGLAGQISWLLIFALIGVLAWVRKPIVPTLKGLEEAGFMGEKGLTLIAMLLWLIPGLLYFSFTTGFWHTYYIATIAPPIAGLVGIAAAGLYQKYLTGDLSGWLLVLAVLITGLLQALFLSYDAEWSGPLVPVVIIGTLLCAGLLAGMRIRRTAVLENHRAYIVAVAIGILFIAPFVWSCIPLMYGNGNILPTAGPQGSRGGGGIGSGMPGESTLSGIAGSAPGISGMESSSFAQDMTSRDRLAGPGNSTRLSDRTSMTRPGTETSTYGSAAAGGVPGSQVSGLSASGSGIGAPNVSGMNAPGGFSGNQTSGRSAVSSGTPGRGMGMDGGDSSTSQLAEYLLAHTTNETWILAVPSSMAGENLIIGTGKPVMSLGGFSGSDEILNVTTFQDYIREGKVRFVQTGGSGGGGGMGGGNSGIFSWVSAHCTAVDLSGGNESGTNVTSSAGAGVPSSGSLYDCAGAAGSG